MRYAYEDEAQRHADEQREAHEERAAKDEVRDALPIHVIHPPTPVIKPPKRQRRPATNPDRTASQAETAEFNRKLEAVPGNVTARYRPPTPAADRATHLAQAIRELLTEHTSGDIIEATWEVSALVFRERLAEQQEAAARGQPA